MTGPGSDATTLAYYAENAETYAARELSERNRGYLDDFMARVPQGGTVLDLGCGAGWAAEQLEKRGFDVHAADGCAELAAIASARIARPARVMALEVLEGEAAFDGIFANAVLHHLRKAAVPGVLERISRALKSGGVLFASVKQGTGEHRDRLDRFYSYFLPEELEQLTAATPGLVFDGIQTAEGVDFAGERQIFLGLFAHRQQS